MGRWNKKKLSRRAVLRGVGGTAVALPFLDIMRTSASAADAPKRFIAMYTPSGTIPKDFWPSSEGFNFPVSPILKPFDDAGHKNDLIVLGGIDNVASTDGPGDAHQKGTGSALTGMPLEAGEFAGMGGEVAGWASGPSVDQAIAAKIAGSTAFPSLEFGVAVVGAHVGTRIAYREAARPLPPQSDPYAMYDRLFGNPEQSNDERAREKMRRKLVLDLVLDDYKTLRDRLGQADKAKLDAHVDSIADIQNQLQAADVEFGGECQMLDLGNPRDIRSYSSIPKIGELQMDILAMAMACDLTRVATFMWSFSAADVVYSWLTAMDGNTEYKVTTPHHVIAHKGDEETKFVAQNARINEWYSEQIASLVTRLKDIEEGDGTVFDNSCILWVNEQSTGNDHSRKDMPYVLIGSAGGHFNTGQYKRYAPKPDDRGNGEKGLAHNRMLATVADAYGVSGDAFGTNKYGKGLLNGLT